MGQQVYIFDLEIAPIASPLQYFLNQAYLMVFALEKERRLSALGGLAAAAAHELGTPLGTIQVVAREMLHGLKPDNPLYEDAELLVSQSQRCRDILKALSARPETRDRGVPRPLKLRPVSPGLFWSGRAWSWPR